MKLKILTAAILFAGTGLITACGKKQEQTADHGHTQEQHTHHNTQTGEGESIHFTTAQFEALNMETGPLSSKNLSSVVQATGKLEVPPQNEATVTAIIGANVSLIKVIEGQDVKKGEVLAYLMHPNLTRIQSDYLEAWNNLQFLEKEYQRQKKLYDEEVGSGKTFQQTQSEFRSARGMAKSLESQLRQLGMDPHRIREGNFYEQVPVVSPINGSVEKIEVKTGQYVQPEKDLFEIVNIAHIHADLMVFEKDIYKVQEGQRVRFTVETIPGKELFAEIYSVGKKFEQYPKAVHVHAEIENKAGKLIPGMYIKGDIITDSSDSYALPEGAIAREGEKYFAFLAKKEKEGETENWVFTPLEVAVGNSSDNWVAVKFLQDVPSGSLFALKNAYYLMVEMKKGEAEHSH